MKPINIFMAISGLLVSMTQAYPLAGQEFANYTLPDFIPERVQAPTVIPNLEKRADTVVDATSSQISEYTRYAGIAATAYCRIVVPLNLWSCIQCIKQVPDGKLIKTFDTLIADTNGFVLRSDNQKTIYLVFRGTNSFEQTYTDLAYTLASYSPVSGASVHFGFYGSFKEALPLYWSSLQAQITAYPSYKVVVTGHSLGAAQALLAGLDLYQRDSRLNAQNLFIHTTGCPRVGNPTFAAYVASTGLTYTRSVNNRDIVPHIPPKEFGYLHAGVEVWYKSTYDVDICTSNVESDKCSNTIGLLTSFTDHITYYGINSGLCL